MTAFKHFFAAEKKLRQSGLYYDRAELIEEFTKGRTSSLRALSASEYTDLVVFMNQLVGKNEFQKANDMRRKVIALLAKQGYVKDGFSDMERINAFCVSHGHAHKELNAYSIDELTKLVSQVDIMYAKFIEGL
jgi:hypothetical protein